MAWYSKFFQKEKEKEVIYDFRNRKYASAKNSPTLNISHDGILTQNKELESSWREVTSRTLSLVRDFPLFSGVVSSSESFVVGDGIYPQITPSVNATKRERKLIQEIEDRFLEWATDPMACDFEGRMNFFEMQALTERQEYEFGEFIAVEQYVGDNFTLQMVEPTRLDDVDIFKIKKSSATTSRWRGLEYNNSNRRVLNYHFLEEEDNTFVYTPKTIVIPANRVLHGFKVLRAGQMRGITPFASAILLSYQLRDYLGSEVTAQNMSSRWLAFVTAPPSGFHTDGGNSAIKKDDFDRYSKALDYATIEYLKNGEQVVVNTQQRQANGFKQFNEIITRYISASTQLPYELISQDYSGLNYTTLRAVRNDFKMHLKPKYMRKKSQFCQPVFNRWLKNYFLKNNNINTKDLKHIMNNVKWVYPSLQEIDALKEFKADLLKIRAGVKSPYSIIKQNGDDPQKVLNEYVQWEQETKALNLKFPELIMGLEEQYQEEDIDSEKGMKEDE